MLLLLFKNENGNYYFNGNVILLERVSFNKRKCEFPVLVK